MYYIGVNSGLKRWRLNELAVMDGDVVFSAAGTWTVREHLNDRISIQNVNVRKQQRQL